MEPDEACRRDDLRVVRLLAVDPERVRDVPGQPDQVALADDAVDVSVQTIFAAFTNKRNVLTGALDVAIAGDDEAVAVNDRDRMGSVWTAP